jgi:exopolysaccharide production protein ExoQ
MYFSFFKLARLPVTTRTRRSQPLEPAEAARGEADWPRHAGRPAAAGPS